MLLVFVSWYGMAIEGETFNWDESYRIINYRFVEYYINNDGGSVGEIDAILAKK